MAKASQATQDFVPIKEIQNGIVTLKDGSLRAVLLASSLNFALKSEDEQNAILGQYQNFLNSLEFSIQIFVQSRDLDIRPYIALLEKQYNEAVDDLMQIQIREYIEFVKNFVDVSNIMTKNFFIVVPYSPPTISTKDNPISRLMGKKKTAKQVETNFEEQVSQLEQRVSVVTQGLMRSGIRVIQLNTEETIELYYKIFNPGEQEKPIQLNKDEQKSNQ